MDCPFPVLIRMRPSTILDGAVPEAELMLMIDDATDRDVDEKMLEQIAETARLISLSENWRDGI